MLTGEFLKKAGDILIQVLSGLQVEGRHYVSFYNNWERIAGTDIANHSRLSDIRNGVLYIDVDHPGWIQLIQIKNKSILENIKSMFPELEVKELRTFLGKFSRETGKDSRNVDKDIKRSDENLDFKELLDRLGRNIVKDD